MLVDHVVQRNTQVIGNNDESIDFAMDEQSMGLIMKGFSDSLYSDKIGSIVREITSNCFDSHIEAGVDTNVDIVISEKMGNEQSTVSFIDYGVGISPERMRTIYSKYGASTKRATNNEIGGWGFGAKVPFAYSHMFEIITRYDNTEYHYVLHRGESVPQVELINKEPTTERNGSEVRIPLKNHSDANLFRKAMKEQLPFFDNVNYTNCGIDNDYQIIRGTHFIVNPNAKHIDESGICLGKVFYPIDWEKIGYSRYRSRYVTPICLWFNVGDLKVTWSRESVEWTDENIEAIQNKIELVKDEITTRQNEAKGTPITDFVEYIKQYKGEKKLTLGDYRIDVDDYGNNIKRDFYYLPNNNYSNYDPNDLFSNYGLWRVENDGSVKRRDQYRAASLNRYRGNVMDFLDYYNQDDVIIFLADEETRKQKRTHVWLQEQFPGKKLFIMQPAKCKSYISEEDNEERLELLSYIPDYLKRNLKKYEDHQPPKEWIKEYNKERREQKSLASERKKREIHVSRLTSGVAYSFNIHIDEVQRRLKPGQVVVYGGMDDTEIMESFKSVFENTNHFNCRKSRYYSSNEFDGNLSFWKVNAEARKLLSEVDGAYTVQEFVQKHRRVMKQLYIFHRLNEIYTEFHSMTWNGLDSLDPRYPLYQIQHRVKRLPKLSMTDAYSQIWDLIIETYGTTFENEPWVIDDHEIREDLKLLKHYNENVPFWEHIEGKRAYEREKSADMMAKLIRMFYKTRHIFPTPEENKEELETE